MQNVHALQQWFPNIFEPLPKVAVMSCITLTKNFLHFLSKISLAVIARNTEQQYGFGSALPPKESHITPGG